MKKLLGVITDVHADIPALQAALAQFDALPVDRIICLGDVVDGGDQPEEVIALLRARGIATIRGNHDRWALARHDRGEPEHVGNQRKLRLSIDSIRWLRSLPTRLDLEVEGVRIAARHGAPSSDMEGVFPDEAGSRLESFLDSCGADILLLGHTHVPVQRTVSGGRLVLNPGALWRGAGDAPHAMLVGGAGGSLPAERPVGGRFGVLELPSRRWTTLAVTPPREEH